MTKFCPNCGNEISSDKINFCPECGVEISLKTDEGSVRHFLYIPMSRYIIMSLITFGLYQIYWIFKNWEYLKNRDGMDIHPFWRGVFGIFYCHELLRAMHDDVILNKNKPAQFNHSALATGWVIIVIISYLINRISGTLKSDNLVLLSFVVIIVLLVIELAFFIPVQRYVNEVNEMINPDVDYYPWSVGHFVLIGIAVVIFGIGFISGMSAV